MSTIHLRIDGVGQAVVSATADSDPIRVSHHLADAVPITREQALAQIGSQEQILDMITVPGGFILTTLLTT